MGELQANEHSKALLTRNVASRIVHRRYVETVGEIRRGIGMEFTSICKNSRPRGDVILAYYPRKAVTSYAILEIATDCGSFGGLVSLYNFTPSRVSGAYLAVEVIAFSKKGTSSLKSFPVRRFSERA